MPTNDFKPFATAGGANVSTQAEYLALAALSTGWQSGKASSKEVNKAVRQATFIAAALAQFVSDKGAVDVLDDGNLAGFGTNLIAAMNKTSQPLDATLTALAALVGAANKLPYFNGADTAALTDLTQVGRDIIGKNAIADVLQYLGIVAATTNVAGIVKLSHNTGTPDSTTAASTTALYNVLLAAQSATSEAEKKLAKSANGSDIADKGAFRTALQLGTVALKDFGTGAGQIPDMSSFAMGTGYQKLPSGKILLWGNIAAGAGDVTTQLPIPLPNRLLSLTAITGYSAGGGAGDIGYIGASGNAARIISRCSSSQLGCTYIAIGE